MAWMSAWCASSSERRRASGGDAAGHSARASAAAAARATAAPARSRAQRGSEIEDIPAGTVADDTISVRYYSAPQDPADASR
jgi:hypothetical protein